MAGESISVRVAIEPRGQGRPRATRRGAHAGIHEQDKDRDWKSEARFFVEQQARLHQKDYPNNDYWRLAIGSREPLGVEVCAVFSLPQGRHLKRSLRPRSWSTKKPDIDNLAKIILDACNGILWHDDAQIAVLTLTKLVASQGESPHVFVRSQILGRYDGHGLV